MAVITAAVTRRTRNVAAKSTQTIVIGTAASIVVGQLVSTKVSTGRAIDSAATAATRFSGIVESLSTNTATCTGNTAGDYSCTVAYGHEARIAVSTLCTKGFVGATVVVKDNNSVTSAASAGTAGVQIHVGELVQMADSGFGWVRLRQYAIKTTAA